MCEKMEHLMKMKASYGKEVQEYLGGWKRGEKLP